MNKKYVLLGFSLSLSLSSMACELPRGEVLKIGCTSNCDFFYRFRLKMTAWGLGHKIVINDLQGKPDMLTAMKEVDGILVPGGADIDPKYYLDGVTPELREYTEKNLHLVEFSQEGRRRDPFEYDLVKTYSKDEQFKDLPLLGICRGFQMMSVAQGIPLYLDIKTELGIKNRRNKFDRIYLEDDAESRMSSVYKRNTFKGYKLHHQGIRVAYYEKHKSEYPFVKVSAYSNNKKIAESIEYNHRPALGVQYHPERSFSGTSVPIFRWFLTKACEFKNQSQKEKTL